MALTDLQIRKLKAGTATEKHFDGGGLYLELSPKGTKTWRLKYRYDGRERTLNFGTYPAVELAQARHQRELAKAKLREGRDPALDKALAQAASKDEGRTFGEIAEQLRDKLLPTYTSDSTARGLRYQLAHMAPIYDKPIRAITPGDLLALLDTVKGAARRGTSNIVMANAVRARIGQIYLFAVKRKYIGPEHNFACVMDGELEAPKRTPQAAVTNPTDMADLLQTIHGADFASLAVSVALRLLPHVFVRPAELAGMRWDEIDMAAKVWTIPGARMKMRKEHQVPLSRQALELIELMRPVSGERDHVFPNHREPRRAMASKSFPKALGRIGFGGRMTAHGFRAMAATTLACTLGYRDEAIEAQLAHVDNNKSRAPYRRLDAWWPIRVKMMQEWSDHLDWLRAGGADVVALPQPDQQREAA